jgi:predicted ribosome quality control (RQC) complex YloA/Tae2 family protein
MNQQTMQQVVEEVSRVLIGRRYGKILQLTQLSFAIDFGLRSGHLLFIASDPAAPRLYLIKRRLREVERQSIPQTQFAQLLHKSLRGSELLAVTKDQNDRIVRFSFRSADEMGETLTLGLIAQLTGRSSNLFLLDEDGRITASLRATKGSGQSTGAFYQPPQIAPNVQEAQDVLTDDDHQSISAALDSYYQQAEAERSFQQRASNLKSRLRQEIRQREKLKANLEKDLADHGQAQQHKRLGDLLLANLTTAERRGSKVLLRDFFSEGAPVFELELDEETSLQEEAVLSFARYAKAKRAGEEVKQRLAKVSQETVDLLARETELAKIIDEHKEEVLADFEQAYMKKPEGSAKTRVAKRIPGVRRYKSSDGYEILVGRRASDNDRLTFRIAKPNDLWLHAADYPGSHVVVRRKDRNDIPQRTIIEAAQLAARFSQASKDSKVVIHYSQRKFLSKPKGAAPGLVRMSSFKSMIVEPKEILERI